MTLLTVSRVFQKLKFLARMQTPSLRRVALKSKAGRMMEWTSRGQARRSAMFLVLDDVRLTTLFSSQFLIISLKRRGMFAPVLISWDLNPWLHSSDPYQADGTPASNEDLRPLWLLLTIPCSRQSISSWNVDTSLGLGRSIAWTITF